MYSSSSSSPMQSTKSTGAAACASRRAASANVPLLTPAMRTCAARMRRAYGVGGEGGDERVNRAPLEGSGGAGAWTATHLHLALCARVRDADTSPLEMLLERCRQLPSLRWGMQKRESQFGQVPSLQHSRLPGFGVGMGKFWHRGHIRCAYAAVRAGAAPGSGHNPGRHCGSTSAPQIPATACRPRLCAA
eukprot:scaffold18873_cov112-Isochrysis_galbana.AAC.5